MSSIFVFYSLSNIMLPSDIRVMSNLSNKKLNMSYKSMKLIVILYSDWYRRDPGNSGSGPSHSAHAAILTDSLGVDVDVGRLACGVLDDQEKLGDDLDHVAGLEDEVALAVFGAAVSAAHQTAGEVGLLDSRFP